MFSRTKRTIILPVIWLPAKIETTIIRMPEMKVDEATAVRHIFVLFKKNQIRCRNVLETIVSSFKRKFLIVFMMSKLIGDHCPARRHSRRHDGAGCPGGCAVTCYRRNYTISRFHGPERKKNMRIDFSLYINGHFIDLYISNLYSKMF